MVPPRLIQESVRKVRVPRKGLAMRYRLLARLSLLPLVIVEGSLPPSPEHEGHIDPSSIGCPGDPVPLKAVTRMGSHRFSHYRGSADRVVFSRDGRHILSSNLDWVTVWDC